MKRRALLLLLLSFACLRSDAPAQEKPELFSKIERAFREGEPAWEVERSLAGESSDPFSLDVTFLSGKTKAAVSLRLWRREQDAREVFAAEARAFDNPPRARLARMVRGSVPGLGDENHIWTNRGSAAWPVIKFRSGRLNVVVFAPSTAVAKRFARRVLEQVEDGGL